MTQSESPPSPLPASRRVFFALPLSEEMRGRIATLSTTLRKAAQFTPAKITWVSPEHYHLTLHFLARVPEEHVQRLIQELPGFAARHAPLPLEFQGLGYFPNKRAPTVLWVGVRNPDPRLGQMVEDLARLITLSGVELVHDNFHAHITLARFKTLKGTAIFVKQASPHRDRLFGKDVIDRVQLIESVLGSAGPTYTGIGEGVLREA